MYGYKVRKYNFCSRDARGRVLVPIHGFWANKVNQLCSRFLCLPLYLLQFLCFLFFFSIQSNKNLTMHSTQPKPKPNISYTILFINSIFIYHVSKINHIVNYLLFLQMLLVIVIYHT